MRIRTLVVGFWAACLLVMVGCGKKQQATPPAYEVSGVKVDIPKLQQAFASASDDLKSEVNQMGSFIRYGQYINVLASLDKLANNPALSDDQKKVVNEVIEQVRQVINKAGPS